MWLIILVCVLLLLIYLKVKQSYKYWDQKGVQNPKPFLVFGNLHAAALKTKAIAYVIEDLYKTFPDERYVGVYQMLQPALMLRDPNLIKQITIKDFETFPNRNSLVTGDADPFFDRTLVSKSFKDGWHDMRVTVSPSFTSSKLKAMFGLMKQCSKEFLNYLKDQGDEITVELKDEFSRYTNDVIATTAFGINCNSLKNKDDEFYKMGRDASDFTGLRVFKIVGFANTPWLMKLLGVTMLSKDVYTFFRSIIGKTVKIREEQGIVRPDMIHLMLEARKGRLKDDDNEDGAHDLHSLNNQHKRNKVEITDDDITAQAITFFLGGAETSSSLMSYATHELAVNPDVQEKLHSEIDSVMEELDGEITYEALMGMKYLDAVVSETLRKHPPSPLSDRVSVRPYTIEPEKPGEKPIHLEKGSLIWIPTYGIHRDPNYYPDPEKFDPERFNDENKRHINPFTFMPFGSGPRNCVGMRFALLQTKLAIAELLNCFEVVPVAKTVEPIRHSPNNAIPLPAEGFWVGLKARNVN